MSKENKLATKLLSILDTMGGVPKKGHNKHQNYYYMREVDVMEALKEQLIKNKIIMLTSSKFVDIQKKEGNAKTEFVTTVETTHTFLDTETGETLPITSVGSGYDSSDKGASKAITASFKYAIMKTFMISDEGADIENDGESKQAPAVKAAPKSFTAPKLTVTSPNNKVETKQVDETTTQVTISGPTPEAAAPEKKTAVNFPKPAAVAAPTAATPAKSMFTKRGSKAEPNFP